MKSLWNVYVHVYEFLHEIKILLANLYAVLTYSVKIESFFRSRRKNEGKVLWLELVLILPLF